MRLPFGCQTDIFIETMGEVGVLEICKDKRGFDMKTRLMLPFSVLILLVAFAIPAWAADSGLVHVHGADYLRANFPQLIGQGAPVVRPVAKDAQYHSVGDTKQFWVMDLTAMPPSYKQITATCRAVGDHSYVFVDDAEWGSSMTQDDVDAVLDAFENSTPADSERGIYETDVSLFGDHSDIDNDPHIYLLFYQLGSFHGYVFDGYFSQTDLTNDPNSNHTEMLHLDVDNASSDYSLGVIAHEFVHLIQANYDPAEAQWMSEALAEIGMVATGFIEGDDYSSLSAYSQKTATTPLTGWITNAGKEMIDYGAVMLWGVYLWEQFGIEFLHQFMSNTQHGKQALSSSLQAVSADRDLNTIFGDFAAAAFAGQDGSDWFGYQHLQVPQMNMNELVSNMPASIEFQMKKDTMQFVGINQMPNCQQENAINVKISDAADALGIRLISKDGYSTVAVRIDSTEAASADGATVLLPNCGSAAYVVSLFANSTHDVAFNLDLSYAFVQVDGDIDSPETEAESQVEAEEQAGESPVDGDVAMEEEQAASEDEQSQGNNPDEKESSSSDDGGCAGAGASALFGAVALLALARRRRKWN